MSGDRGLYVTRQAVEILSAAVALREFTRAELSAYVPADISTVYDVLNRLNRKHDWFTVRAISQNHTTADQWCLRDEHLETALTEVERMEAHLRTRRDHRRKQHA